MSKSGLILSGTIATVGALRILFPEQISSLFSLDLVVAVVAIFIALVGYSVWFGSLNFLSGSWLMRLVGSAILIFGLVSINSPTLFGARQDYLPMADIFLFIESGILLQMIGLERKPSLATTPVAFLSTVSQTIVAKLGRHAGAASTAASTR